MICILYLCFKSIICFNTNADSLSRQHQTANPPLDLGTVLPGTALPESLRNQKAKQPLQVTQLSMSVLPSYTSNHLLTLQQADPVLGPFLQFWRCNSIPDKAERQTLSKSARELVRQWNRVVEKKSTSCYYLPL